MELYNLPVCLSHLSVCKLVNSPHAGQATQIDMLVGSVTTWAELIGRILRWFTHRRGSPAHQWHFIRFLRRGPGSPRSLRL